MNSSINKTINLEPDNLECEVKWALGSLTMNTASGGDGIPVELFQTLKDDAVHKTVLYISVSFAVLRDGIRREEGGGFRMGNTCIPVADSFRYLAKLTQYCKV